MASGLTLDTGALIALENRSRRVGTLVAAALTDGARVTVPASVVVEWWRGQRGPAAKLCDPYFVEPLTDALARIAGKALADVTGPSPTDAVVMASAAQRGDTVITSDIDDLSLLSTAFPAVRILGVRAGS